MAVRPKTLSQAKASYSTNWELAWWVFMRVSGLALIFLVFGHLFMNNMLIDAAKIDYNYVASRFSQGWVKVYDSFLLALAMLHGANGLRYVLEDYLAKPRRRFWAKVTLFSVVGMLFIMGVMTLWAFSYQEMGDAIRALPHE
jgi:succinate dehydrogenase / fumarate reductase, membrane anchor subunit